MGLPRPRTVTFGVPVGIWFVFFLLIFQHESLCNFQDCGGRSVCGVADRSSRVCDVDRTHLQADRQSCGCCELNQSTHSVHSFVPITEVDALHV